MKIETEFEVNQRVWLLNGDKAKEVVIQVIEIKCYGHVPVIHYWVDSVNVEGNLIREDRLYATKELLLESI